MILDNSLSQTETNGKRFKPRMTWNDHDEIQVRGYRKLSLIGWLKQTDRAVALLEQAHERCLKDPLTFAFTDGEQ